VGLADLTRGMRKNKFQSLRNSFSAKPDFIPSGVIPQKGKQK
jgi:hypothetical protein